jgi:hypothetical protein
MNKRVEDYNKVLPIIELYLKEADLVDQQLQYAQPDVRIDVSLEREAGVIVGIHPSTQRKEHLRSKILLTSTMRTHTLQK